MNIMMVISTGMSLFMKSLSEFSNVVVISQPMYFPWVGFLSQISMASTIIWLDDVQFSKGSFTNRVQIKNSNNITWLTCNLKGRGTNQLINQIELSNIDTVSKQRNQISHCFKNSLYQYDALGAFDKTWKKHSNLSNTIIKSTHSLCKSIGIKLPTQHLSSNLNVSGRGSERVKRLVQKVGGDAYLTGHGAAKYLDHYSFESAKIAVHYMRYENYHWQQFGDQFTPFVTGLDLVANVDKNTRIKHLVQQSDDWRTLI